jgi:hypothetical protein
MQIKKLKHGDLVFAVLGNDKYAARIEVRMEKSPSKKENMYVCIDGRMPIPMKDWEGVLQPRPVLTNNRFLQMIKSPVCVADGEHFQGLEFELIDFLEHHNIPHVEAENLYKKPFDLSRRQVCTVIR